MRFPAEVPVLTTPRLTLRAMTASDIPAFAKVVVESPNRPDRDAHETWQLAEAGFAAQQMITWAIEIEGELAGTIGFYRGFAGDVGEVGYMLQRAWQGQRVLSEALPVVLKYAYGPLGLVMITAYTEDANEPSVRLLRRHGFTRTEQTHDKYRRWEHRPGA